MKVSFTNSLDTSVLDKSFYLKMLEEIQVLKSLSTPTTKTNPTALSRVEPIDHQGGLIKRATSCP